MRGFDIRSVGPSDPVTGLVLGGNKSLLVNIEQIISIAGPVRVILFYDAGQVRNFGQNFSWTEPLLTYAPAVIPPIIDPLAPAIGLTDPTIVAVPRISQVPAFKTSTGAELRFFMPVLNVPFRLIFAMNPQRAGVLDNSLQPQSFFQFRFAVGTTF
jgi:outer membrane protein assembly factor BamA